MARWSWIPIVSMLAACATPYAPPVIDRASGSQAASFDGIMKYVGAGDVRVVWLHGMCTHDRSWAVNRHSIFARAAGLGAGKERQVPDPSGAFRVDFSHHVREHDLEMRYLVWSPLAAGAKLAVKVSDADPRSDRIARASLNARLKKGLINDCFSDAVIYTGRTGDGIRAWARQEVCDALGGQTVGSGGCSISPRAPRKATIFVAESLGSKILSDALLSIWQLSPGSRSAIAMRLADVQLVFLVANQIPLLSAATSNTAGPRTVNVSTTGDTELVELFADARSRVSRSFEAAPSTKLRFVAFTDPNDLLSYRLYPGVHAPEGVEITNILVSNDRTYFGWLERPDTAHCGYGWNPAVMATLAEGYDGRRFGSVPVRAPKQCGLGD